MPMGAGAKTVLVGGWVGGWAGSPTGRYQDLESGTEWFTAEKGFVYQPKIIPQRDTPRCGANRTRPPNSGRLCAPRRETRCARASCASAGRVRATHVCATHSAGISFHTQRKLSHDTHCERGSREGSPSDFMGRLDAWRSAAWRVCRLKRRLLHGPRRCPQSRSPANRPRALVGLAVDDIWSGEADNLSERGAR